MNKVLPPEDAAAGGFTILEMLVVLSILALLAVVVLPALSSPHDGVRLRTAGSDVLAALRLARATAIMRNTDVAVVIDVDRRILEVSGSPAWKLGAAIAIELKIADPERASPSRGGFRFFADGSSTGGDIVLRLNGREVGICIDWLTGRAKHRGDC